MRTLSRPSFHYGDGELDHVGPPRHKEGKARAGKYHIRLWYMGLDWLWLHTS